MVTIARVKRATAEFIKILRFGKNDVQTADNVLPYGVDSKPIKNVRAVHSDTSNDAESVVLGYLLKSEHTEEGEIRVYSTDTQGVESFFIMLKKDGTCEIGGGADFLVKYNELNTDLGSFITSLNSKLTTAFTGVGGSWTGISIDISSAKNTNVRQ